MKKTVYKKPVIRTFAFQQQDLLLNGSQTSAAPSATFMSNPSFSFSDDDDEFED